MKRHLIRFFSKPHQAIFATAIAVALLFGAVATTLPPRVKVSLSFTVAQQARQETADYSYDGYYVIRASELISDTLISWLSTPSVIKEVYDAANVPLSDTQAYAAAGRAFRAKKFSSQNVVVTFEAPDTVVAAKLATAASKTLSTRADGLVTSSTDDSLFSVTGAEPVIAEAGVPPKRAALAGAFVGAFIGLALAYATTRNVV